MRWTSDTVDTWPVCMAKFMCIQIKFMWMTVKRMWNQSNCVEMSMTKSFFFLLERERMKKEIHHRRWKFHVELQSIDFLFFCRSSHLFVLTIYNHIQSKPINMKKKKLWFYLMLHDIMICRAYDCNFLVIFPTLIMWTKRNMKRKFLFRYCRKK